MKMKSDISTDALQFAMELTYDKQNVIQKGLNASRALRFKRATGRKNIPLVEVDDPGSESLGALSFVLRYSFGLLRYTFDDPWKIHRGFPSARCLYPTECYIIVNCSIPGLESGVYHFDPLSYALDVIGTGSHKLETGEIFGEDADSTTFVLVFGSEYWRLGEAYGNFAYTLALLEAGHAIEQVNLLVESVSWKPQILYSYSEKKLKNLLRLPLNEEGILGAVAVRNVSVLGSSENLYQPVDSTREPFWIQSTGLREGNCSRLQMFEEECQSGGNSAIVPKQSVYLHTPRGSGDMATTTVGRNSGHGFHGISGAPHALQSRQLDSFAGELMSLDSSHMPLAVYYVAIQAADFSQGLYRFDSEFDRFALVEENDYSDSLQSSFQYPFINLYSMIGVFFIFGSILDAFEQFGPRGYRWLNLEAGRAAQRLGLHASKEGLFMRPVKSFDEKRMIEMCKEYSLSPLYGLILGESTFHELHVDLRL